MDTKHLLTRPRLSIDGGGASRKYVAIFYYVVFFVFGAIVGKGVALVEAFSEELAQSRQEMELVRREVKTLGDLIAH